MSPGGGRQAPAVPYVVFALIALNVLAFVQETRALDIDRLIDQFATIPYDVTNSIVLSPPSPPVPTLTILSAMFMHASVAHVASNMLFLLAFGRDIEYACGHARFLAFYLLCGIAGGIAQIAIGPGSHVPELGASGAIAGVLGAYIVTYPTARMFLGLPAAIVIAVWAFAQFWNGFGAVSSHLDATGGTAYFAHIGGFAFGVIAIGLFRSRRKGTPA